MTGGLAADDVLVSFRRPGGGHLRALDGVSVVVRPGRCVAVIGESGSGKSTLLRVLACLVRPERGAASLDGRPVQGRPWFRSRVQVVQQDPYLALNSHHRVSQLLGGPLRLHRGLSGSEADAAAVDLLAEVNLAPDALRRWPDAFSGGQRQRLVIARALVADPDFLLLDEPLSALDPRTADGITALLQRLRTERNVGYLFVSHDLEPVARVSEEVVVMRDGRVVESGPTAAVLAHPQHPYSQELLRAR